MTRAELKAKAKAQLQGKIGKIFVCMLIVFAITAVCSIILQQMSESSAYPALLTGLQAYSAEPGVLGAMERSVDLLIAAGVAYFISFLAAVKSDNKHSPGNPLARHEARVKAITIFCAVVLYKVLSMPQGIWIILTIIFIYIVQLSAAESCKLVRQRILTVPAGIILGGVYSGTLTAFDYRMAYLGPLIGAVGFFMLYYRHDFFRFTMLFMVAFTICADWLAGTAHEFNFLQLLAGRSLATVIGAAVFITVQKASECCNTTISAT